MAVYRVNPDGTMDEIGLEGLARDLLDALALDAEHVVSDDETNQTEGVM